jgi:WhiB family redox-sensing transcriptional regulator
MAVLERSAALPWATERPDLEEFFSQWRPAWMAQGRCHGQATATWFPAMGGDLETPKAICELCPVLAECRAYALERPGLMGIWGGTSDRERIRMRKARA